MQVNQQAMALRQRFIDEGMLIDGSVHKPDDRRRKSAMACDTATRNLRHIGFYRFNPLRAGPRDLLR